MDGVIDNEGRVEVCIQGVWGTICSWSGWEAIDGYVVCKEINLGTSGICESANKLTYASQFGMPIHPILDCTYSSSNYLPHFIRIWRWQPATGHVQPSMLRMGEYTHRLYLYSKFHLQLQSVHCWHSLL